MNDRSGSRTVPLHGADELGRPGQDGGAVFVKSHLGVSSGLMDDDPPADQPPT